MKPPLSFTESLPASTHAAIPGSGYIKWLVEVEQLRAHPDQWTKLTTRPLPAQACTWASHLRKGRLAAFRPVGAFEATVRGCDVWVRFVGEPTE